jgi:uncharacterized protein (DUF1800 family)
VVHLHRRAGFAATWAELQRDLAEGPEASLDRILRAKPGSDPGFAESESTAGLLGDAAVASREPARLKAWWLYRMLAGLDPLGERLALMWHDHFATSNLKVDDVAAMRRQNDLFREFGRGPFGDLLGAVVRDPAMLIWLDAPANRKAHPNENLARELMELFTLGVGRYAESDVKEAARALTGWTVEGGRFRAVGARHDDGEKTVLGRSGRLDGDALLTILVERPATASRLAWRLCGTFFGEGAIDDAAIASLADGLRSRGLDVGWAVGTILRSRAFFDEPNLRTRVLGPAEFVVGAARLLERLEPPPSTLMLAEWMARLGQDLFYPPNVGGWPGGRSWLSGRALLTRGQYVGALLDGRGVGLSDPLNPLALAARHGRGDDPDSVLTFLAELILGRDPGPDWRRRIVAASGQGSPWGAETARRALATILAGACGQLG